MARKSKVKGRKGKLLQRKVEIDKPDDISASEILGLSGLDFLVALRNSAGTSQVDSHVLVL